MKEPNIEIIEEDKPLIEQIDEYGYKLDETFSQSWTAGEFILSTKLNEIIDHINRKDDK